MVQSEDQCTPCLTPPPPRDFVWRSVPWVGTEIVAAIAGAVVGGLLLYYLPGLARRWRRGDPVYVHVDTDPRVIHAGDPNWFSFSYVLPERTSPEGLEPPSETCSEWLTYFDPLGAFDGGVSKIRITLQGRGPSRLIVDGLRVNIATRRGARGIGLTCPVGGASVTPRAVEITLDNDPPVVAYHDDDGQETRPFLFSLGSDDIEVFYVEARAKAMACEWTAELLLIENGSRRSIAIDNQGRPFRTSGMAEIPVFVWWGENGWSQPTTG